MPCCKGYPKKSGPLIFYISRRARFAVIRSSQFQNGGSNNVEFSLRSRPCRIRNKNLRGMEHYRISRSLEFVRQMFQIPGSPDRKPQQNHRKQRISLRFLNESRNISFRSRLESFDPSAICGGRLWPGRKQLPPPSFGFVYPALSGLLFESDAMHDSG